MIAQVVGYTLKMAAKTIDDYPELRTNMEEMAGAVLLRDHGITNPTFRWTWCDEFGMADPDTGEWLVVPPLYCLIAEGMKFE